MTLDSANRLSKTLSETRQYGDLHYGNPLRNSLMKKSKRDTTIKEVQMTRRGHLRYFQNNINDIYKLTPTLTAMFNVSIWYLSALLNFDVLVSEIICVSSLLLSVHSQKYVPY